MQNFEFVSPAEWDAAVASLAPDDRYCNVAVAEPYPPESVIEVIARNMELEGVSPAVVTFRDGVFTFLGHADPESAAEIIDLRRAKDAARGRR